MDRFEGEPRPAPRDQLELVAAKRMVVQHRRGPDGAPILSLYHGDREIEFDDPAFFGFGETLARQGAFAAEAACRWGGPHDWSAVRPLLAELIAAGILRPVADASAGTTSDPDRRRASPLPPAPCPTPRDWSDCAAITAEIAGRAVDPGHLELVVPMFRIAHPALDRDGRQVGEANVFPRALRLDVPTEWKLCTYPGSRFEADRPMNATALMAMRQHWPQMMSVLLAVRAHFLTRFPNIRDWTVGDVERLAAMVLAVPTHALVRRDAPVANGALHPVLASVFRVTDGLRLVMHQMMFVPVGEPALPPETPVTIDAILDYAERNHAFHSETGVCAGPRIMVRDFLETLILGATVQRYGAVALDQELAATLGDLDRAFDYGLRAMRAHAALFAAWPATGAAYQALAGQAAAMADATGTDALHFRAVLEARRQTLETATYLGRADWRQTREHAYRDMFDACGRGLGLADGDRWPADGIAPDAGLVAELAAAIGAARDYGDAAADAIARSLATYLDREQRLIALAADEQDAVNALIGRPRPARAFASRDVDIHNRLQGADRPRLPYLLDDMADLLGLGLSTSRDGIEFGPASEEAARCVPTGLAPVDGSRPQRSRRAS